MQDRELSSSEKIQMARSCCWACWLVPWSATRGPSNCSCRRPACLCGHGQVLRFWLLFLVGLPQFASCHGGRSPCLQQQYAFVGIAEVVCHSAREQRLISCMYGVIRGTFSTRLRMSFEPGLSFPLPQPTQEHPKFDDTRAVQSVSLCALPTFLRCVFLARCLGHLKVVDFTRGSGR